jgi:hypothetical protein
MQIIELLASEPVNINRILAATIAHEIGHNLGLEHEYSPTGIMFDYGEASANQRKFWLQNASKGELEFRGWQITKTKLLIKRV